ncbi:uncharacterized protein Dana_GF18597 [Drosophila ananassae]|uniref:Uncharacterized protein n=1 Tax=Drosophila ananassae TaxID=7217 RepID=B3LVB9_DROAN|nr:bromodomain-containing protein 4 isoform X1 [Drosophila ananassae]XP_032305618.1 bromodomain-containing protein 4 isoform X1 [Drosophila ananassae]XP_032305619.1 bromodomain-containing protein 4 isoform X2 [Drosophila ananassae]EDV43651.2 uncharacterized protein Dana_GF18597 [Drosophila ananassae]
MRGSYSIGLVLMVALLSVTAKVSGESTTETPSALLPLEARNADVSGEEDVISTSYVLPNQIFNEGKPYYARQDPISGQLDFSAKKPAGIQPEVNEVVDPDEKVVLSGASSPNIHDFLNLPVKYSSSKFVYPLVSSSYANLKYQGSNKNYITNKKPTSVVAPVTPPPPSYHSSNYFTVPTTKLTAVTPTAGAYYPSSSTTSTTSTTTTTTTAAATTTRGTLPPRRPSPTTTTTTVATSPAAKYTTTSRRPIPINVSTTPQPPRTSTTRKKFVPTKKYSPTVPSRPPFVQEDHRPVKSSPRPTPSSNDVSLTTHHATPQAPIFPTEPATTTKMFTTSSTSPPVVFTEGPTPPPAFSPIPGTGIPNLDPADVYHTLGQKNTQAEEQQHQQMEKQQHTQQQQQYQEQYQQQQYQLELEKQQQQKQKHPYQQQLEKQQQQQHLMEQQQLQHQQQYLQQQHQQQLQHQQLQPQAPNQPQIPAPSKQPMTLSDIFNSLAEEESNVAHNYQQNQGFDAQGNLIEPIAPSKPSPFAMQHPGGQGSPQQRPIPSDQKVISGSQENYSNEYVSYQVQQPNMMQYRPVPGQINNVVISPGQQSASFVLGSQVQQVSVGHPSVEKEPLFAKDTPGVQYGQVINEDIGNIKRPAKESAPPTSYQQMPNVQQNSNFHQNGNVPTAATPSYQEPPPEAPSPYQQLPLIGSNKRPSKKPQVKPVKEQTLPTYPQSSTPLQTPPTPPADSRGDETKELLVSTNIRFPAQGEESVELSSSAVMPGPPAGPHINGHAQPLSLQQIQNSNPVVFPKIQDEVPPGGANVQIQQHEVVNLNQQKPVLKFPAQQPGHSELPSQNMEPPPRYPTTLPGPHAPPTPGKRPPGPPPPFHNEFNRKPQTGPRPSNLPNILPQFRPNAKISSGHPPALKQEPGNIRLPQQQQRPYNPSVPPQFAHRRQPLPQQQMLHKRYPMNRISEYPVGPGPGGEVNRRVYRLPPYGGQNMPYHPDHMYPRRPHGPGPLRSVDGYLAERHAPSATAEPYKTIDPESAADFEEEDLVINDPPQPVTPAKDRTGVEDTKLEPVVTLQMLQSQKKAVSLPGDESGAGEIQVTAENDPQEAEASKLSQPKLDPSGLYVVFPMKGAEKGQMQGEAPSAPAEYQNTPFSVIRDQPQEPILKNKKPQSLQQHNKAQQLPPKEKFPYPIEKPDPSFTELNPDNQGAVPGVLVAPRIITGALGTGTETPIAIAYTPTEPSVFRRDQGQKFSNINLATSVINEIRQDTQTEEGLSSDFDLRGQNFEKDFMAPFYPSVSLGGDSSGAAAVNPAAPSNWNIVPSTTDQGIFEKNKINRADLDEAEEKKVAEESVTASALTAEKSSDMDSFQPQLQGGFKPIYPPGYKHVEQIEQEEIAGAKNVAQEQPLALPLVGTTTKPVLLSSSSTSTSSTSTTTSTTQKPGVTKSEDSASTSTTNTPAVTPKPTQRKKSTFETSLAALLFGDENEDEEDGARKSAELPKAQAGPRNVPRMGPRSLKLR